MPEQRKDLRRRVIYGGVLTFNDGCSTMDCVVRNFSSKGAKVEITGNANIPDHLAIAIKRKCQVFSARVIWRSEREAGLAFIPATASSVIPFDRSRIRSATPAEHGSRR
jgi:hypothetical protein